jgi:hypothetical protein
MALSSASSLMVKKKVSSLTVLSRELRRVALKLLSSPTDRKISCSPMEPESESSQMAACAKLTLMVALKLLTEVTKKNDQDFL